MKKKLCILMALVMMVTIGFALTGCGDPEKDKAIDAFNAETELLQKQLDARTAEVEKAQTMLAEKKGALDDTIQPALEKAIDTAVNDETVVPELPKETEDINATTEQMKSWEELIAQQIEDMKGLEQELDKSRKQYAQIVYPTEDFVKDRLKSVSDKYVTEVEAVTEENDANKLLNKQGGYTAQVIYRSPLVEDSYIASSDIIEAGTECGGSVEVFKTVSEAEARNDYLATYDGQGILNPGSHNVYGTIVIRTSDELTATQQKKLEKKVLKALTKLEDEGSPEENSGE